MGYTGVPYVIKQGDTLWDIAAQKLGDSYAWPRLYAFNNQKDVLAAGARRIKDPDLIYAGAKMMLPIPPGQNPKSVPSAARPLGIRSLKDQIPRIQMPVTFAYDIKGDSIVLDYGSFVARIRQKGRVAVTIGQKTPLTMVLNGGFELSNKTKAQNTFTTLMSDNKVTFDPRTKGVTFSNKLVSQATNIPGPKTEVALEVSTTTGMPVLKVAIAYPQINGSIAQDSYSAIDYKIEIEIEPRMSTPVLQPVPVRVPSPARAPQTDWDDIFRKASTSALILAGVVTVAYGASVVFSGGTSLVGSPAYASTIGVILIGATVTTVTVSN